MKPVPLSRDIENALLSNFLSLVRTPKLVAFSYEPDANNGNARNYNVGIPSNLRKVDYTMLLSHHIGPEIVCLFPNHPKMKKRVLRSSKYSNICMFNSELNARFRASLNDGPIKFAVCYGSTVYHCHSIEGTIYVVWPEYINCRSESNAANNIGRFSPVLFNLNGHGRMQCIYIFKENPTPITDFFRIYIGAKSPVLLHPPKPLFVCEVRPPPEMDNMVKTTTRDKAVEMATAQMADQDLWINKQRNPYESSVDNEDPDIDMATAGVSFEAETGLTPRNSVFIVPTNRDPFEDD